MVIRTNVFKFFCLISLSFLSLLISIFLGDTPITFHDLIATAGGHGTSLQHFILFDLRLPHALNAFVIGCLLAFSGYLMQVMLSNPLADPYTLGSSGGAAVFTLLGLIAGLEGIWLVGCSFAGSIIAIGILLLASGNWISQMNGRMPLVGMVLAAGWGALLSLLLILSPTNQTRPILFWLFGDVDSQSFPLFSIISLGIAVIASIVLQKEINVLNHGALMAKTLGVEVKKLHIKLIVISSLLTAAAVSMGGTIGFIGLIVPHMTRKLINSHHYLFPLCNLLLGGCLLLAADIISRIAIAPEQLPIGLFTTLLGIPLFIYLSRKGND
ncbi:MAG: iron ABC transporter permease [Gammaproteobacteria bacterium]|nr:iron ABC transporter permease [Gammaproteobacteria bacterium]